jgi:superfamily I DNA and RNA helicase
LFSFSEGQARSKADRLGIRRTQDVFDVRVRTPEELSGEDDDGEPGISLQRALPDNADTNDFVLPKCYRNQRDVLVLAHSIGFGIYGEPVQMLQNRRHWEDVGYEVVSGDMRVGTPVVIRRPDRNSPTHLSAPDGFPLIQVRGFDSIQEEVNFCADEFARFLAGGLQPEDLMAIAIDGRAAKACLSALAAALAERGISSNNIIADRYSEPAFTIAGKATLSDKQKWNV